MPQIPKVAVLVDTSYSVRRDFLLGVTRYAKLHGPWSFWITSGEPSRVIPRIRTWGGQGIIAPLHDDAVIEAVLETNVPTIALCLAESGREDDRMLTLSDVAFDAAADVAKLAIDHFVERHFRSFAFVGVQGANWSVRRQQAFAAVTERAGFDLHTFKHPQRADDRRWEKEQFHLADWIRKLPKPVGILAANDDRGRQVLEACRLAKVSVPDEVAVLGVDNDETFCDVADPPLSSIALGTESAGFCAAELLDGIMNGSVHQRQHVSVRATRVITRRSTEHFAVDDRDVADALKFIRECAAQGISVKDVVAEVALSRRNLEKRFHRSVGRTVLEEIQRVRLETSKLLLSETDYPVSRVAALTGYATTSYFLRFFRNRTGMSPTQFRALSLNAAK
jgi:LacI family transcriptional regulator